MILQQGKPYMLRSDGEVFEVSVRHPYIYDKREGEPSIVDVGYSIFGNASAMEWFYQHTMYDKTQYAILDLIKSYCEYEEEDFPSWCQSIIDSRVDTPSANDAQSIETLFVSMNDMCNQEFLRFRTSDLYYGNHNNNIYFRVSSVGFNWFNLIWNVVYENRSQLANITICRDGASFGNYSDKVYQINSESIDNMPINDFITLKGNPIIEHNGISDWHKTIMEKLQSRECYIDAFASNMKYISRARQKVADSENAQWFIGESK